LIPGSEPSLNGRERSNEERASPKFLIETDVLAEFLVAGPSVERGRAVPPEEPSLLRRALGVSVCYTTMLNVMELFRATASDPERNAIAALLRLVRVLGFHARYARPFAEYARTFDGLATDRETMVLGMAKISNLTILTKFHFDRYRHLGIVDVWNVIPAQVEPRSGLVERRMH
jgi:hypothetical protein